jgi:dolichol kinase
MQAGLTENNTTPMKGEVFRKMIHYSSASISIGYYYMEKNLVLVILSVLLLLMLGVEFLKYKSESIYNLYLKYFKDMLREHEYDRKKFRFNGASWVILSCIICIFFFPKLIAIMGMLMLSLADSTAGLLGRLYGKKQYAPNRSFVGTLTFFVMGLIVIAVTPKYTYSFKEYIIGIAAVVITTFAEAFYLHIDDNLTIPIVGSLSLYVLYLIFMGGVF